jgi:plastocyanin
MKPVTNRPMLAMALLCCTLGASAAQPQSKDPPAATIELEAFMFSPSALTVPAGTTVIWKNLDPEPHTVASVDGKFRSGAIDENEEFRFTFDVPGTYRYVCSIHPQMVGTVIVAERAHAP